MTRDGNGCTSGKYIRDGASARATCSKISGVSFRHAGQRLQTHAMNFRQVTRHSDHMLELIFVHFSSRNFSHHVWKKKFRLHAHTPNPSLMFLKEVVVGHVSRFLRLPPYVVSEGKLAEGKSKMPGSS